MKKVLTYFFLALSLLCLLCLCAVSGCGPENHDEKQSSSESEYFLNVTKIQLNMGEKETLVLNNADASKVQWETFNDSIATVENGIVTAIKDGAVNIAAVYGDEIFICRVIVVQSFETIPVLEVTNVPLKVAVGDDTIVLDASLKNGTTEVENVTFTWESTNTNIISVDGEGKLTVLSAGSADIIVSCLYENEIYTTKYTIEVV